MGERGATPAGRWRWRGLALPLAGRPAAELACLRESAANRSRGRGAAAMHKAGHAVRQRGVGEALGHAAGSTSGTPPARPTPVEKRVLTPFHSLVFIAAG